MGQAANLAGAATIPIAHFVTVDLDTTDGIRRHLVIDSHKNITYYEPRFESKAVSQVMDAKMDELVDRVQFLARHPRKRYFQGIRPHLLHVYTVWAVRPGELPMDINHGARTSMQPRRQMVMMSNEEIFNLLSLGPVKSRRP